MVEASTPPPLIVKDVMERAGSATVQAAAEPELSGQTAPRSPRNGVRIVLGLERLEIVPTVEAPGQSRIVPVCSAPAATVMDSGTLSKTHPLGAIFMGNARP